MSIELEKPLPEDELWSEIRKEIADEYAQPHSTPWIIGFSGGKDSTLVAHLVVEHLLTLPKSERKRQVHVVSNDTLVESPLVIAHLHQSIREIANAANAFSLPITTAITTPDSDSSFWVNLIGRGYPTPNRTFRWCTDRLKIQPTTRYIKSAVDETGKVILLLGVRRSESASRAGTVAKYDNGERLHKHSDLTNCFVFRPIVELTTDDVWEFLATEPCPWGGSHKRLIQLYRDAGGGECPVVTSQSDAPSCGTSSSRFGCWTCTVVEKDKSLAGFVDAGFSEFTPLVDFRDWLVSIRDDPNRRQARRRTGKVTILPNGTYVPGPFTLGARREILDKLISVQDVMKYELVSRDEIERIKKLWAEDAISEANRIN